MKNWATPRVPNLAKKSASWTTAARTAAEARARGPDAYRARRAPVTRFASRTPIPAASRIGAAIFALCLSVTVLLLIGAGAGLFLSERMYARQALALDALTTRLQQLFRRNPFPAAANVHKEAENLKDVIDQFNELNEFLRDGRLIDELQMANFLKGGVLVDASEAAKRLRDPGPAGSG